MTRTAAILGLGERGATWAERLYSAGWEIRGFDPEIDAKHAPNLPAPIRATISGAVDGADIVVVAVPERIELIRSVVHRAQGAAKRGTIIAVAPHELGIDDIQKCAIRARHVVRISTGSDGAYLLDVSGRNDDQSRETAREILTELAAATSVNFNPEIGDHTDDAESA